MASDPMVALDLFNVNDDALGIVFNVTVALAEPLLNTFAPLYVPENDPLIVVLQVPSLL